MRIKKGSTVESVKWSSKPTDPIKHWEWIGLKRIYFGQFGMRREILENAG